MESINGQLGEIARNIEIVGADPSRAMASPKSQTLS